MAEAFARKYGSDVLKANSAGLSPAFMTVPQTRMVLSEKAIDLGDHLPKSLESVDLNKVDLLINMTGQRIPYQVRPKVEDWKVRDPIGAPEAVYREVRDHIEMLVMNLVLRMRTGKI
jgi:protein-tyrosine-phosphatase